MALQNFPEGSPGLRLWASTKIMAMSPLLVSALPVSPTANNPSCNLSGDFTEVLSTGRRKIQASPHHSVVTICEYDKVWTLQTFPSLWHCTSKIHMMILSHCYTHWKHLGLLRSRFTNSLPFCGAWGPQSPEPGKPFLSLLCLSSHDKKSPFKIQILMSERQNQTSIWI